MFDEDVSVIKITRVCKCKNRIETFFDISDNIKSLFKEHSFWTEYDENIEDIPDSIAVVPFLSNAILLAWVFNLKIYVSECDLDFYNCLSDVKGGYQKMYEDIPLRGELYTEPVQNIGIKGRQRVGMLFSGGVDATFTMICHLDEKPFLIPIWGADIPWENAKGWEKKKKLINRTAEIFNLSVIPIKSNLKSFYNSDLIWDIFQSIYGYEWWHDFQCGLGMLGLMAPYTRLHGIGQLLIASSFSKSIEGTYFSGSDPSIDNYIHFCDCEIVHDGFEYDRQQKIETIVAKTKKYAFKPYLHVCWEVDNGKNCCICEKCIRTELGLYAAKADLKKYGFEKKAWKANKLDFIQILKKAIKESNGFYYVEIQRSLRKQYFLWNIDHELRSFYNNALILNKEKKRYRTKVFRDVMITMMKYPEWKNWISSVYFFNNSEYSQILLSNKNFVEDGNTTDIKIEALDEKNRNAEGTEITLLGMVIDGKMYFTSDIISDGWMQEYFWRKWNSYDKLSSKYNRELHLKIPANSKKIDFIFKSNRWSGICSIRHNTNIVKFDTWSAEDNSIVLYSISN